MESPVAIEGTRDYKFGMLGEGLIAAWLRRVKGRGILPVYELQMDTGKGPGFFAADGKRYVAPDMLAIKPGDQAPVIWVEAKHKEVFTWHRKTERWTTGIDRHHYREYLAVVEQVPWPLWLLFLHESEIPDDRDKPYAPGACPVGLFGQDIAKLKCDGPCRGGWVHSTSCPVSHEHDNWGTHGMIYWAVESLRPLANLEEVREAQRAMAPVAASHA